MYTLNEEIYIVLFSIENERVGHLSLKLSSLSEMMNYSMNHFCEKHPELQAEILKVKRINLRKIKSSELDRSIILREKALQSCILKCKDGLRKWYVDYLFLKALQEEISMINDREIR